MLKLYIILWWIMLWYSLLFYFFEKNNNDKRYSKRRKIKEELKKINFFWEHITDFVWYQFTHKKHKTSMNVFQDQNWKFIYLIQLPYWFLFEKKLHSFYFFHELWHIYLVQKFKEKYTIVDNFFNKYFKYLFFLFFILMYLSFLNMKNKYFWILDINFEKLTILFWYLSILFWSFQWLYIIIEEIFANFNWYKLMKNSKYKLSLKSFLFFSSIWIISYMLYFYISFLPYFFINFLNK